MVKVCECCGQTLPPAFDLGVKMGPGLRKIVETLHKAGPHGMPSDRLFNAIYDHRADGGPESGIKVLHVRISQLNKRLRTAGYNIRGEHTGSEIPGFYRLEKL